MTNNLIINLINILDQCVMIDQNIIILEKYRSHYYITKPTTNARFFFIGKSIINSTLPNQGNVFGYPLSDNILKFSYNYCLKKENESPFILRHNFKIFNYYNINLTKNSLNSNINYYLIDNKNNVEATNNQEEANIKDDVENNSINSKPPLPPTPNDLTDTTTTDRSSEFFIIEDKHKVVDVEANNNQNNSDKSITLEVKDDSSNESLNSKTIINNENIQAAVDIKDDVENDLIIDLRLPLNADTSSNSNNSSSSNFINTSSSSSSNLSNSQEEINNNNNVEKNSITPPPEGLSLSLYTSNHPSLNVSSSSSDSSLNTINSTTSSSTPILNTIDTINKSIKEIVIFNNNIKITVINNTNITDIEINGELVKKKKDFIIIPDKELKFFFLKKCNIHQDIIDSSVMDQYVMNPDVKNFGFFYKLHNSLRQENSYTIFISKFFLLTSEFKKNFKILTNFYLFSADCFMLDDKTLKWFIKNDIKNEIIKIYKSLDNLKVDNSYKEFISNTPEDNYYALDMIKTRKALALYFDNKNKCYFHATYYRSLDGIRFLYKLKELLELEILKLKAVDK